MASPEKTPDRFDVEKAIEASALPTCSRDILYCLARRMDQGTIFIPPRFAPSLAKMAGSTGWSKRHIQRHLNALEEAEVIARGRTKGKRTKYAVNYPVLLGTRRPEDPEKTRDTESLPVGTPGPGTWDTEARELGTGSHGTRDTTAPSQISQISPDQGPDPEIKMIRRLLMARTGTEVTAHWAATTRDMILTAAGAPQEAGPGRTAYIRLRITRDTNPQRWLPTPAPPPFRKDES